MEGGGGGGCIFIYSCSARRISFQIDQFEYDLKRNSCTLGVQDKLKSLSFMQGHRKMVEIRQKRGAVGGGGDGLKTSTEDTSFCEKVLEGSWSIFSRKILYNTPKNFICIWGQTYLQFNENTAIINPHHFIYYLHVLSQRSRRGNEKSSRPLRSVLICIKQTYDVCSF